MESTSRDTCIAAHEAKSDTNESVTTQPEEMSRVVFVEDVMSTTSSVSDQDMVDKDHGSLGNESVYTPLGGLKQTNLEEELASSGGWSENSFPSDEAGYGADNEGGSTPPTSPQLPEPWWAKYAHGKYGSVKGDLSETQIEELRRIGERQANYYGSPDLLNMEQRYYQNRSKLLRKANPSHSVNDHLRNAPRTCLGQKIYIPKYRGVSDEGVVDPFTVVKDTIHQFGYTGSDDKAFGVIENTIVYFLALSEITDVKSLSVITFMYLKTFTQKSIVVNAVRILSEVMFDHPDRLSETKMNTQAGIQPPSWLEGFRSFHTNWRLLRKSPAFKKVSELLSICVALGLCEVTQLEFGSVSLKQFVDQSSHKHATSLDLTDAALGTFIYFMECGYLCFTQGSVKPLLFGNLEEQRFHELYQQCMLNIELHRGGNLLSETGITDEDFCVMLENCRDMAGKLSQLSTGSFEKVAFTKYRERTVTWIAEFMQTRVRGGLRIAPYMVGFNGGTGVGKSTVANVVMATTLQVNGYSAADDRVITLNESDQYDSNMRTSVNGIFIDDLGNTKAQFVREAPTAKLVRICNNVRTYANMAEAELKGKVAIEPKVVTITTNVKNLCASTFSNEPASITRRCRIMVTVRVKEQYSTNDRLDPDKVTAAGLDTDPFPDLWDFLVERPHNQMSNVAGVPAQPGWMNVNTVGTMNLRELLRWIAHDSAIYFGQQKRLVLNCSNFASKTKPCMACLMPERFCECVPSENDEDTVVAANINPAPLSVQAGFLPNGRDMAVARMVTNTFRKIDRAADRYIGWANWLAEKIDTRRGTDLVDRLQTLENNWLFKWTNWIPEYMFTHLDLARNITLLRMLTRSRILEMVYLVLYLFLCGTAYVAYTQDVVLATIYASCVLLVLSAVIKVEKDRLYTRLVRDREAVPVVVQRFRDGHVAWIAGACLMLATAYMAAKFYRQSRRSLTQSKEVISSIGEMFSPQGNINPKTIDDIAARDSEVSEWKKPTVRELPASVRRKTTSHEQLLGLVAKNLCDMQVLVAEREFRTNVFFPCSNVMLVPDHVFIHDELDCRIMRNNTHGGSFATKISKTLSVKIPDHDLRLVWVPNGGDWKDLTTYLPTSKSEDLPATLIYKDTEGDVTKSPTFAKFGYQKCGNLQAYWGAKYELTINTFRGLCMAPLISEERSPAIIGFHLGGRDGSTTGCCGSITTKDLADAMKTLSRKPGVLLSHDTGTARTEIMGVQFYEGPQIHPKSPVNFMDEGSEISVYGSSTGRAKYYSDVVQTPISASVAKHTGSTNKWGPPKFGSGHPWHKALQTIAHPSPGVPGNLLSWAAKDYLDSVWIPLKQMPELVKETVPLTRMQTVNGIKGKRFIDRMPSNTSIGHPLKGPKSRYFIDISDPDDPESVDIYDFPEPIWEEVAWAIMKYNNNERVHSVLMAYLKDEATSKDKVRTFAGLPAAMQIIIRMYFLPVARNLSMLPLKSECAVGVNALGDEWDQMHKHIVKFGETRILAGDYKSYDLKMPAQLTMAAFSILIELARRCGYDEQSLRIMRGVATDVCYPMISWNGDLLSFNSTNPSGHNLTVYVNCIVNSLLLRCAYKSEYMHSVVPFNKVCALITYGDDCCGSVSPEYPGFNHLTVARFLASVDMVFTMPNKVDTPIPYMTIDTVDFLKRKSVYHPALKVHLGALEDDSIFKSLHSVVRSPHVSAMGQCIGNIDGAAREWFAHGEQVYEMRRAQLRAIADDHDLGNMVQELDKSYKDRIGDWIIKYRSKDSGEV